MRRPPLMGARAAGRRLRDHAAAPTLRRPTGATLAGLTSLRFLGSALRRGAWLWCGTAIAALGLSAVLFGAAPPASRASATILITNDPVQDPNSQMQGNIELAQSEEVAQGAVRALGLHRTPASFLGTYSAQAVTDRLMQITASAPTTASSVREANVVVAQFLQFRAQLLTKQQKLAITRTEELIVGAKKRLKLLAGQIRQETARPPSGQRKIMLRRLTRKDNLVGTALGELYYSRSEYPITTQSMIQGSRLLDPAAQIPPSRRHMAVLITAAAFTGSLALGLGVVAVWAVVSDRLRRRDDVARALGAPVSLSIGRPAPGGRDADRLVAHLRRALPSGRPGTAALAVVAVDNERMLAESIALLGASFASSNRRVVIADLSAGAEAARGLGVSMTGIHEIGVAGESVVVAIPDRRDGLAIGPFRPASPGAVPGNAPDALAAICRSADVLLSFATLDPATGAEHLATWAADAVVIVSAGRSQSTRIHAIGEMIRLAGMHLHSAVLVGADKNDESLGTVRPSATWPRPTLV